MEIKKEITVNLTVEEIKQIIKEHLKDKKNIDIKSIYFNVNGHEQEDDLFSQFPLSYELDEAICKGEIE